MSFDLTFLDQFSELLKPPCRYETRLMEEEPQKIFGFCFWDIKGGGFLMKHEFAQKCGERTKHANRVVENYTIEVESNFERLRCHN